MSGENKNDYTWPKIEDYEATVGFKVNEAFRAGWDMARTKNSLFTAMVEATEMLPQDEPPV